MINIQGKSLITTDWHFGLKSNSENRIRILTSVTKSISAYMKNNKIDNFIFCGDWYHSRSNLAVNVIHISMKCLEAISRNCNHVYLILGNHDIFNKNSVDINSVSMFRHIKNLTIVENMTECDINGKKCLFVPWLGDVTSYEKNTFDMIFGHFDINPNYLVNAFIEESTQKNMSNEEMKKLLKEDPLLAESGLGDIDEILQNDNDTYVHREKTSDLIGDWIEVVKPGGSIFAGHIHNHRELYAKSRRFIFVGSPYQQTRGEIRSNDGFYIMNEDGEYDFHELDNIPKFVDIRMSTILNDIEGFDYDIVKNNIIHKIYDVELDRNTEVKINQKIYDRKPFEELESDYLVSHDNYQMSIEAIDNIKKSKLEYLYMYINNIDDKILKEKGITKKELQDVAVFHYDKVSE